MLEVVRKRNAMQRQDHMGTLIRTLPTFPFYFTMPNLL